MIEIRPAAERFRTRLDRLDSRHSFSFGPHYDPRNTSFGLLLANNEDVLAPGAGFETHRHRGLEIVTWVLAGALAHRDSTGRTGLVTPGLVQRMSAGDGIDHSESNADAEEPVRFVQMWVSADDDRSPGDYASADVTGDLRSGGLVPVASGRDRRAAIAIRQPGATLYAAELGDGGAVLLPSAPYVHVFVTCGAVVLEAGVRLGAGDAARVSGAAGQRLSATGGPAQLLVWGMHARQG